MTVKFYAWVHPLSIDKRLDHTWVTTYDKSGGPYASLAEVAAAGQYYWMCWGDFHPEGVPAPPIATSDGELSIASCLVEPNADSRHVQAARGTIFTYAIDGVCHQLANQALFATGISGQPPQTVKDTRGYWLSSYLYGTYGRQKSAWLDKVKHCTSAATSGESTIMKAAAMATKTDEFAENAQSVLADDPALLEQLMALREGAQMQLAKALPEAQALDADLLNAQNQKMFDEAAALLGPEKFEQVFGFKAGEKINLVDPAMVDAGDRTA
jgi:hypothetical protein